MNLLAGGLELVTPKLTHHRIFAHPCIIPVPEGGSVPTSTTAQFTAMLQREPAAAAYSVSAALVPILATWLHWDARQAGAAAAILVALSSVLAAMKARPVSVPVLYGGAVAITTALAAWHLKVPVPTLATVTSLTTVLLGAHMRSNLTPVVALRGSKAQQG